MTAYWTDSWTRYGTRFPIASGDTIRIVCVPVRRFDTVGYLVSGGPGNFATCTDPTAIAVTFS